MCRRMICALPAKCGYVGKSGPPVLREILIKKAKTEIFVDIRKRNRNVFLGKHFRFNELNNRKRENQNKEYQNYIKANIIFTQEIGSDGNVISFLLSHDEVQNFFYGRKNDGYFGPIRIANILIAIILVITRWQLGFIIIPIIFNVVETCELM